MLSEQQPFEGRAGIVTGASGGIGAATCRGIVAAGGRVLAVDRDREGLDELAAEVGEGIETLAADLAADAAHDKYVQAAKSSFGGVDFLFNNAGVEGPRKPLAETSSDEWDETMAINLRGCFLALRAVVPAMRERGGGQILNMGSCLAVMGAPGTASYSASKHAVVGITRCLAAEEANNGITVNCLCPGPVETPLHDRAADEMESGDIPKAENSVMVMIPVGRFGRPAEIAKVAQFLLAPGIGYLTGATISMDGGMTGALYRRSA